MNDDVNLHSFAASIKCIVLAMHERAATKLTDFFFYFFAIISRTVYIENEKPFSCEWFSLLLELGLRQEVTQAPTHRVRCPALPAA